MSPDCPCLEQCSGHCLEQCVSNASVRCTDGRTDGRTNERAVTYQQNWLFRTACRGGTP